MDFQHLEIVGKLRAMREKADHIDVLAAQHQPFQLAEGSMVRLSGWSCIAFRTANQLITNKYP